MATPQTAPAAPTTSAARSYGLVAGVVAFAVLSVSPAPDGLTPAAWQTAAVVVLMAIWWTTEAIPIAATAMLPLVLFPTMGVLDMPSTAARYANDIVFLSMGGFLIAVAMERSGLHRRMALWIVAKVGTRPRRLVLGFMLASAFLSMWISNTATTAMMYPIAMAIAIDPSIATETGNYYIDIETNSDLTRGQTVVDYNGTLGKESNVELVIEASHDRFMEMLFESVKA